MNNSFRAKHGFSQMSGAGLQLMRSLEVLSIRSLLEEQISEVQIICTHVVASYGAGSSSSRNGMRPHDVPRAAWGPRMTIIVHHLEWNNSVEPSLFDTTCQVLHSLAT
jgi:hypothetical protein